MHIGNLEINQNTPIFLAPMAGVTDVTYRNICREMGADFTCTEMVSAKALSYNNKNTKELLKINDDEHPVAVQLFGSEPDLMADMALRLEEKFDVIDVNMGCPVAKVVNNGEGSALMKNPKLAGEIVKAMADKLKKPVTVKIRSGFDDSCINAPEFAKMLEDNGASAITVHGRTRAQMYSGHVNLDIIRQVKESVSIPVIGNGDIFDHGFAISMLKETGVDGVMIARGCQGNPWLFCKVRNAIDRWEKNKDSFEISYMEFDEPKALATEICEMILRHAKGLIAERGEKMGVCEMRKHIAWYTKGLPGSASLREKANYVSTYSDIENLINSLSQQLCAQHSANRF